MTSPWRFVAPAAPFPSKSPSVPFCKHSGSAYSQAPGMQQAQGVRTLPGKSKKEAQDALAALRLFTVLPSCS
jgi:hypothetical protein